MKESDRLSSHSPSARSPEQGQGALNEAHALFERMAGEAKRRSELEREEARARSPVARLLLWLTIAACLLAAATGIYGIHNFPDAPIRKTAGGYVGKIGKPHTQEDYEAFIRWEKAMFIVFPSAFALGFAFAIAEAARRRKLSS
jgi:hypothetical protein